MYLFAKNREKYKWYGRYGSDKEMWNPCNHAEKQYFSCLLLNKEQISQETILILKYTEIWNNPAEKLVAEPSLGSFKSNLKKS